MYISVVATYKYLLRYPTRHYRQILSEPALPLRLYSRSNENTSLLLEERYPFQNMQQYINTKELRNALLLSFKNGTVETFHTNHRYLYKTGVSYLLLLCRSFSCYLPAAEYRNHITTRLQVMRFYAVWTALCMLPPTVFLWRRTFTKLTNQKETKGGFLNLFILS